jgi:arginyl-tRNA synthetase
MSLQAELSSLVGDAFESLGLDRRFGAVSVSQRPDFAQFQCNGALAAAKPADRSPRDVATEIELILSSASVFSLVEIAGPGFINLSITDTYLAGWLDTTASSDRLGLHAAGEPKSVIVDYGGPNVAKDLHVGHLRPAVIGESLKRTFRAVGHDVRGDVHLGDWGLPMGQLIAALHDDHPDWPYFGDEPAGGFPAESPVTVEDLQGLYPRAAMRFGEDAEFQERARAATVALQDGHPGYRALWSHFRSVSVDALAATYGQLGVDFELWLGEASVSDRLEPLVERLQTSGTAVESDGAVVIHLEAHDDTAAVPPLMLLNSRGGATYATTDLATIEQRVIDFGVDEIVYVVDLRQSLHFVQLFRAARLADIVSDNTVMTHAGNGTVNGPDGKPFKTRQGRLPRLSSLLDEVAELARQRLDEHDLATDVPDEERDEIARLVGLAAIKFGELSNHRTTDYAFDLQRFTQMQGRTGPYLLYVAVRTKSILARLASNGIKPGALLPPTHDKERQLALMLLRWPETVDRALETLSPNTIAEYSYDLAGAFNQFYDTCHILSADDPDRQRSWLALVALTQRVLVNTLDLLTIDVPDRM